MTEQECRLAEGWAFAAAYLIGVVFLIGCTVSLFREGKKGGE